MLDPKMVRSQPEKVAELLLKKRYTVDVDAIKRIEQARRQYQGATEELERERNLNAKAISKAVASGEDITEFKRTGEELKKQIAQNNIELKQAQSEFEALLMGIPNIPLDVVPEGTDESDNLEVRRWGEPREFDFEPKDHVQLGERNSKLDFETGAKITGSRFVVMRGAIAQLHRALVQFMLDIHVQEHGYEEINIPYIVNCDSLLGTGQLPKFEDDLFKLDGEQNYYLIPTAEVPVTNVARDEIIGVDNSAGLTKLPIKYVCHSPCFRSEAGSYGRDTRGMIRQHQFEKVELVQFVSSEDSLQALEDLTQHAEAILQKLNLPYRTVILCGGDLGFSSAKTYDIEVWLPGQQKFREISSCSVFTDFQARRMRARWRNPATGKVELLHTLNGSGLAIGRTLVAVLENYQQADGSVLVPEALQPYMKGAELIQC